MALENECSSRQNKSASREKANPCLVRYNENEAKLREALSMGVSAIDLWRLAVEDTTHYNTFTN